MGTGMYIFFAVATVIGLAIAFFVDIEGFLTKFSSKVDEEEKEVFGEEE